MISDLNLKRHLLASGDAPLYNRLANALARKIEIGEYCPGDLFPGDKQLAFAYGVSMITARAAMRVLIERGLVVRYAGKGSFVLRREQESTKLGLGSIEDLVTTGLQTRLVLLKKGLTIPPEWVLEKYSCPPHSKLYWFRTVRLRDGERFLTNDIYYRIHIGRKLSKLKFSTDLIRTKLMVTLLEEECGFTLSNINQTIKAELASADIARTLGIKRGQPILTIDRDYFSTKNELMQVARTRYRLDHYQLTCNVSVTTRNRRRS